MCKEKTPEILYHYCSIDSFVKMMKNGKIRFQDITKSNDSEELYFLIKLYLDYLKEKNKNCENVSLVTNSFDWLYRQTLNVETSYCFCLSAKRDNLGQWRGYANNGGVCIGFKTKELEEHFQTVQIELDNSAGIYLKKVKYIDVEYSNDTKLNRNKKELIRIFNSWDNKTPINNVQEIKKITAQYKNSGFLEEDEWRFVFYNFILKNGQPELPKITYNNEQIRLGYDKCTLMGQERLKKYYDLPFPFNAVSEIIIGPKTKFGQDDILLCFEQADEIYNISKRKLTIEDIVMTKLTYR